MTDTFQVIGRVVRVRIEDKEIVMLQTKAEAYIRIALYQTEPQMGIKIVGHLPQMLRDAKVKQELELPDYDKIRINPGKHPPREADIMLLKDRTPVARFSVKFSPSGSVRYVVESWKYERSKADLLGLIPLRAISDGKTLYFIALVRIPYVLSAYPVKTLVHFIRKLIDEKKEVEGFDLLWPVNIKEVSAALRDYEILRRQDEMLRKQDEMSKLQRDILKKQEKMLELQQEMLKKQDVMINLQKETIELLKEILKTLKKKKEE